VVPGFRGSRFKGSGVVPIIPGFAPLFHHSTIPSFRGSEVQRFPVPGSGVNPFFHHSIIPVFQDVIPVFQVLTHYSNIPGFFPIIPGFSLSAFSAPQAKRV